MVYVHNGILLSHKRNTFESVPVRQMNLEPIIQSEMNQKAKGKYRILTHTHTYIHIWNLKKKYGIEEFTYRASMEKQT